MDRILVAARSSADEVRVISVVAVWVYRNEDLKLCSTGFFFLFFTTGDVDDLLGRLDKFSEEIVEDRPPEYLELD